MVWQTSTGWHFTDTFFRTQSKHGPYPTEKDARAGLLARMAYHGVKLMWT